MHGMLKAGIDDLIGVVVFFIVIARIIGALKKNLTKPDPNTAHDAPQPQENTLQSFFEMLEQQARKPAVPPPTPYPPSVPKKERPTQQTSVRTVTVSQKPEKESIPKTFFVPDVISPQHPGLSKKSDPAEINESSKLRAAIIEDVRTASSLKKALVLSEVLGPPVGLRQNHLTRFWQ